MVPAPSHQQSRTCALSTIIIMSSMALMDAYLGGAEPRPAEGGNLHHGDGGGPVFSDSAAVCGRLGGALKFGQPNVGYAMILWFLYIFVLEIKVYFVYQNLQGRP
ncbi:hypothetical protein MHYP_G00047790 [Metynnis hypsauchen]